MSFVMSCLFLGFLSLQFCAVTLVLFTLAGLRFAFFYHNLCYIIMRKQAGNIHIFQGTALLKHNMLALIFILRHTYSWIFSVHGGSFKNIFVSYFLVCKFTGNWCRMNVFADSLAFTERSDISTV